MPDKRLYSQYDIDNREHENDSSAKRVVNVDGAGNVIDGELAARYVTVGDMQYIGEAEVGSLDASAVWRIIRIEQSAGEIKYADGDSNFDNVWDDHASLTYA